MHTYDPPDLLLDSRLVLLIPISFIVPTVAGGEPAGFHTGVNAGYPQEQDRNWQEEVEEDPWAEGPSKEGTAIWEVGMAKKGLSRKVDNCPKSI